MGTDHEPPEPHPDELQHQSSEPAEPQAVTPEPEPKPEPQPEPEPSREPAGLRFYAKLLALLFVIAYSVAFIVGNDKRISVDFVFATARVSLIWSILLLLGVGVFGGALLSHLYRQRRAKQPRKP